MVKSSGDSQAPPSKVRRTRQDCWYALPGRKQKLDMSENQNKVKTKITSVSFKSEDRSKHQSSQQPAVWITSASHKSQHGGKLTPVSFCSLYQW